MGSGRLIAELHDWQLAILCSHVHAALREADFTAMAPSSQVPPHDDHQLVTFLSLKFLPNTVGRVNYPRVGKDPEECQTLLYFFKLLKHSCQIERGLFPPKKGERRGRQHRANPTQRLSACLGSAFHLPKVS